MPANVRVRIDEIDGTVAALKAERTGVNRDVKTFAGFVDTIARQMEPGDVEKYTKPMDVTELMERQQANAKFIKKAKTVRAAIAQRTAQLAEIPGRIEGAKARAEEERRMVAQRVESARILYEKAKAEAEESERKIASSLNETLAGLESERASYEERKANGEEWLKRYEAANPENTDVPALLAQAEEHNRRYNVVCQYREKKAQFEDIKAKADKMDADIAQLAEERATLIANAKLPIDGLTFTDDGLELNGVPFVPGKVSDSQTMEIAAKLVIASNPTVKVFRIARGESLGAKRLETIVDIARRNGFQGFLENVVRGQEELRIEEYTER